jgi:hypothetical protein
MKLTMDVRTVMFLESEFLGMIGDPLSTLLVDLQGSPW